MAKNGLKYFTVDTDIFQDRRIKRLKKDFGCNGFAVYLFIINEVYRVEGCVLAWDENTAFDVAEYFGLKENLVCEIVKYCGVVGLFDKALLSRGIITSASIQQRYLEMCKRAKRADVTIPAEYKIREEMAETPENSEKFPKNSEEIAKTPEENNKVNKSKANKNNSLSKSLSFSESDERKATAEPSQKERDCFFEIFFFRNFVNPEIEVERFIAHYTANGWKRNGQKRAVEDRAALAMCWSQEDKNAKPHFPKDFLDNWKFLYEEAKKRNETSAKHLLYGLKAAGVFANTIELHTSALLKDLILRNANFFNEAFFLRFYPNHKIVWR